MFAKVILGSKNPSEFVNPIYTIHCHYPRFIHSEIMTHRVFSRNARSSRAVPVEKMIEEVETNPVIPWHWGKNQPGMQAGEECNNALSIDSFQVSREEGWIQASKEAVKIAKSFMVAGYHKQIVNRLLEPFMWIDTLITSTEWDNFFELRIHKDAEPHIRDLAIMIKDAIDNYQLYKLEENEWHLPYVTGTNEDFSAYSPEELAKISAARCARISYKAFDGSVNIENDFKLYSKLIESKPMHASPVEHQAVATLYLTPDNGNLSQGWEQYRKIIENE